MFTGLIQGEGKVHSQGRNLFIEANKLPFSMNVGDSIAVDGVCLTVSSLRENGFLADISEETFKRTTLLAKAKINGFVNLEPALRLSERLGGHLVSGHVDGLGTVAAIESLPNSWNLRIQWEEERYLKYICEKASIALNGISLTIAELEENDSMFSIAVIPHTWINTSLKYLVKGESVNLEADLMAKYAERILLNTTYFPHKKNGAANSDISQEWLASQGWD